MTEHTNDTFQVDLRGLVDLLSHHLYSSPKVYVRELLQNGIDAVTMRGATDDRPAILLTGADQSTDGRMHCFDSGVGLDDSDVRTFLATIGRSSKRDELGFGRGVRLRRALALDGVAGRRLLVRIGHATPPYR